MRVCRSALWALYTAMTMKEPCVDFMLMEAETVTIQMGGAPYIYKCMSMVQKEFEDMAADLRRRIVTLARGFRLDSDSAEDVAQDTMLKLWTIREKIDGKPSAAAMATTIARHLSIDMLRRNKTIALDMTAAPDSSYRQPDSLLQTAEDDRWLKSQLDKLPTKEHAVLHLRQVEHKTTEEIAAIVGVSAVSVPTMLARARKKLFDEIKRRR